MKITTYKRGTIEYVPFSFQQELLNLLKAGKKIQLESDRQMGVSTSLMNHIITKCNETQNYNCIILYPSLNSASDWCKTYKFSAESVSEVRAKKYEIGFVKTNSNIKFVSAAENHRGRRYDRDIFVEYMKYIDPNKFDKFLEAVSNKDQIKFYSCPTDVQSDFVQLRWERHLIDDVINQNIAKLLFGTK